LHRYNLSDNQHRVLSMFDKFDKDNSGYLEMDEVGRCTLCILLPPPPPRLIG
jgi:hypothetical protein